MRYQITTVLALLSLSPNVQAWGIVGHATVATIAANYLTPAAKTYVSNLLGPSVSMPSIASWADDYRYTAAGRFSAPYHFIDAEDHPPTTCSVTLSRDCPSTGCIISAITNYTSRVSDARLSAPDRKQALEFLVHFLGDITQPLHDEAVSVGGNDIHVLWNGTPTNLHSCWDTQMVEKAAGGANSTAVLAAFAGRLITQIDNGTYAGEKAGWVSCVDVARASECALEWAKDANAINCEYVLRANETGVELDGAYYAGAQPWIELQISKGGYRLGAWLNALAAAAAAAAGGEEL